jgi:hypothetical protein
VGETDVALRNLTYRLFVALGRAPSVAEIAAAAHTSPEDVMASLRRLHDAHALVLDGAGALWMLHPFSAVPTPYRVLASDRWWHANCAWDAFGILAALHVDGHITATCADCDEPIEVDVRDGRADDEDLVFHCLVPATHWWDDIAFT